MDFNLILLQIALISMMMLQVILGIVTYGNYFVRMIEENFLLTSQVTLVEMLEKFSRIVHPVNLKVHVQMVVPAQSKSDTVWINREWAHGFQAAPNLWTLMEVVKHVNKEKLDQLKFFQEVLFLVQVGLAIASYWLPLLAAVAIVLVLLQFLIAVFIEMRISKVVKQTLMWGQDLLDLDEREYQRAEEMMNTLYGQGYAYPVGLFARIAGAFKII